MRFEIGRLARHKALRFKPWPGEDGWVGVAGSCCVVQVASHVVECALLHSSPEVRQMLKEAMASNAEEIRASIEKPASFTVEYSFGLVISLQCKIMKKNNWSPFNMIFCSSQGVACFQERLGFQSHDINN